MYQHTRYKTDGNYCCDWINNMWESRHHIKGTTVAVSQENIIYGDANPWRACVMLRPFMHSQYSYDLVPSSKFTKYCSPHHQWP